MKRNHNDDLQNKNKRFSFPNDRPPPSMQPSHSPGSNFYSYQPPMQWVDPRSDHQNRANMNIYPHQNMMMQWNGGPPNQPPPNSFPQMFNPMQPPPPLPPDRPPNDAPPPPPPHGQMGQMQRRPPPNLNNNMRRKPLMGPMGPMNQMRPDHPPG